MSYSSLNHFVNREINYSKSHSDYDYGIYIKEYIMDRESKIKKSLFTALHDNFSGNKSPTVTWYQKN